MQNVQLLNWFYLIYVTSLRRITNYDPLFKTNTTVGYGLIHTFDCDYAYLIDFSSVCVIYNHLLKY